MEKITLKELLKSINPSNHVVIYSINGLLSLESTPSELLQQLSDKHLSRQVIAQTIETDHIAIDI